MTSLSNWLHPAPRRTPNACATYWPDTGFLSLPELSFNSRLLDDVLSDRPVVAPEVVEFSAVAEHEQTHWIQAHAFGYGRFTSRIDHARTEIAESFFALLPEGQVTELLAKRLEGRPILELGPENSFLSKSELGPVAIRLQRHWWGLGLLRYEFDSAEHQIGRLQSIQFRYGLSVLYGEVGPNVSEVALLPDKELLESALARAPSQNLEQEAWDSGFPWLSSMAIAECAAVLNQHWSYANVAEVYRRNKKYSEAERITAELVHSWESKEMTPYADAFRVFRYYNPASDLNKGEPLATLNVICCLSLDGNFAPEIVEPPRSWREVYPPLRFCALAEAVKKVGLLGRDRLSELDVKEYNSYLSDLFAAASLPCPQRYDFKSPIGADKDVSPVNDLRELIHNAAIAATKLQGKFPAAIICPSESAVFHSDDLSMLAINELKIARIPPLMIIGGRAVSVVLDAARFSLCAQGGAYQRLLSQLFSDSQPLMMEGLPTCSFGKILINQTVNIAESRIQKSLPMLR